ncbi:MAG: single-stranded DNA-binding protein [Chloroflexaceae bacterium]|nr:single-stranded DNA-binding protein [Chloroflexaceae bacterium]
MSRGLNKLQIIGRLGRDPEMRYTSQGTPVTNFSVATGGKWTDRDGNERDDTEWFRVDAWDRLAEICNQYLTKGREVYVEGRLKTRKYTDRDGVERTSIDVVASNVILLGGRGEEGGDNSGSYEEEEETFDAPPPARTAAPARQTAAPQRSAAPAPRNTARGRNQPQPIESDMGDEDIPF